LHTTLVAGAVFTIVLMVKEVIILKGLNLIGGQSIPNPFYGGVV
jgi:hypothetical protein